MFAAKRALRAFDVISTVAEWDRGVKIRFSGKVLPLGAVGEAALRATRGACLLSVRLLPVECSFRAPGFTECLF